MQMQFTCPNCGTTTDEVDDYAGQTGPCVHCGTKLTVPSDGVLAPRSKGFPLLGCFLVFTLIMIVGDLAGLLLPAIQAAREAKRRYLCSQNLKQIGLAMQNYHREYGCFPPAFISDANGKPKHSWRVLLLPFLDQEALYSEYRFDEPWDSPHNIELARRMPSVYRCPSEAESDISHTSYAMIVSPHAFSDGPTPRKIDDIKDGLSNTIMVAECADAGINWLEPRDLKAEKISNVGIVRGESKRPPDGINSCHSVSIFANVLLCDGTVRAIPRSVDDKVLKAMLTIDGGEIIEPKDFEESLSK